MIELITLAILSVGTKYISNVTKKNNSLLEKFTISNNNYHATSIDNAKTLNNLRKIGIKLIEYSLETEKNQNIIKKLKRIYDVIKKRDIFQNIDQESTSYTLNKKDLYMCLKGSFNDIVYVFIHELAHLGNETWDHDENFKKLNKYLLKKAIKKGLYNNINYKNEPKKYCGINIKKNILFD